MFANGRNVDKVRKWQKGQGGNVRKCRNVDNVRDWQGGQGGSVANVAMLTSKWQDEQGGNVAHVAMLENINVP